MLIEHCSLTSTISPTKESISVNFRNIVKEFQDKCRCCRDQDLLLRLIVNSSQDKTSLIGKTSPITNNSQKLGRACIVSVLHQKQKQL